MRRWLLERQLVIARLGTVLPCVALIGLFPSLEPAGVIVLVCWLTAGSIVLRNVLQHSPSPQRLWRARQLATIVDWTAAVWLIGVLSAEEAIDGRSVLAVLWRSKGCVVGHGA